MAALQSQMATVLPQAPPPQLAMYAGKLNDKLDIDKAAFHLANFLTSCVTEMKLAIQAVGKNSIKELNKIDLVSVNKNLSGFLGVRYAGSKRVGGYQEFLQQTQNQPSQEYMLQ